MNLENLKRWLKISQKVSFQNNGKYKIYQKKLDRNLAKNSKIQKIRESLFTLHNFNLTIFFLLFLKVNIGTNVLCAKIQMQDDIFLLFESLRSKTSKIRKIGDAD